MKPSIATTKKQRQKKVFPKIKWVNLFYISQEDTHQFFEVYHRQISGPDKVCAVFYYGTMTSTVSMTRAKKAAKAFCKQMNTYYPLKVNWCVVERLNKD